MTEEEKGYLGWTNYETWVVMLWIDNEESDYNYWQERATEIVEENGKGITPMLLADELKEAHEEASPVEEAGVFTDLLYSALEKVNWYEIAKSILDEVKE